MLYTKIFPFTDKFNCIEHKGYLYQQFAHYLYGLEHYSVLSPKGVKLRIITNMLNVNEL